MPILSGKIIHGPCKSPPHSVERAPVAIKARTTSLRSTKGAPRTVESEIEGYTVFPLGNAASSVTITNPRTTLRSMTLVATKVERARHPNANVVQDPAGSSCDGRSLMSHPVSALVVEDCSPA